jgi:hypothetical protein
MELEDGRKRKKMPGSPILAPKGFTKGAGGKMGQYTGGLAPGVVKSIPGVKNGRVAAVILRPSNMTTVPSGKR